MSVLSKTCFLTLALSPHGVSRTRGLGPVRSDPPENSMGQTSAYSQHTHTRTHILSTCRVCPGTSPQVANLSAPPGPVSSSCSLGRAAVTVHRRRRGLHRRVRPPASMATTATCTRFTDDYQLFEELGKDGVLSLWSAGV